MHQHKKYGLLSLLKWSLLWAMPAISLVFLCRCGNEDSEIKEEAVGLHTSDFEEEGMTLRFDTIPENLNHWIGFYGKLDPSFNLQAFKSSGVVLHLDSLPDALTGEDPGLYKPLLAWSPDSLKYIDWVSYGQILEKDSTGRLHLFEGGPDQEVALADRSLGSKKQLLFYGPGGSVEAADWLGNGSFLLGLLTQDPVSRSWVPEIYLFDLQDSTFTNFRLNKEIPPEVMSAHSFNSWFLKQNDIILNR